MQINGISGHKIDVTWNQITSKDIKMLWSSVLSSPLRARSSHTASSITLCVSRQLSHGGQAQRQLLSYLMTADSSSQAGYEFQFEFGNKNNYSLCISIIIAKHCRSHMTLCEGVQKSLVHTERGAKLVASYLLHSLDISKITSQSSACSRHTYTICCLCWISTFPQLIPLSLQMYYNKYLLPRA